VWKDRQLLRLLQRPRQGDLSENAEYDAAKEAQGLLELRIAKLEDMIANARIIDKSKINTKHVQMLNKVKLKNLNNNSIVEYTLVSESEANLSEGKLAAATPIGKALIGRSKGDVVEVKVPSGVIKFEILDISI
jgi:transcription elongation factor GreA